jgi:3D (Asp-Asp-Asp) domain-containing protein
VSRIFTVVAHLLASLGSVIAPKHWQPAPVVPIRPAESLSVTAYCLPGRMADGHRVHAGAAAGNRWAFGTELAVPGYGSVTIEDRIGSRSDLDLWMPSCTTARRWGRRQLSVTEEAA